MSDTTLAARLAAFPRRYLWQAPRGLFYKLTRNSDARMRAAIAGRHVVLVGNAASLMTRDFGAQIDAADVVIRLNRGFVVKPEAQGTRTDIASLTPTLTEDEIETQFDPDFMVLLTPKLRHLRISRARNLRKVLFYAHRYWMADRQKIGRRPSSGYMMLSYLLRLEAAASITLYGFDFGATDTYYNPQGYQTPHDFAAEGQIIQGWEADGRIRIMRS